MAKENPSKRNQPNTPQSSVVRSTNPIEPSGTKEGARVPHQHQHDVALEDGRSKFEASFSGPLPMPQMLKAYDLALPGLAERIVVAWEKQSAHRMELEKIVIQGDNERANKGQWYAFWIAIIILLLAALLAVLGHETLAVVLAGIDLTGLAGVFLYGTHSRRKEREEKMKILVEAQSDES